MHKQESAENTWWRITVPRQEELTRLIPYKHAMSAEELLQELLCQRLELDFQLLRPLDMASHMVKRLSLEEEHTYFLSHGNQVRTWRGSVGRWSGLMRTCAVGVIREGRRQARRRLPSQAARRAVPRGAPWPPHSTLISDASLMTIPRYSKLPSSKARTRSQCAPREATRPTVHVAAASAAQQRRRPRRAETARAISARSSLRATCCTRSTRSR